MSSNHKLALIKAILYASDSISDDEKFSAIQHLIHGWDKELTIPEPQSWLKDLSVETRDVIKSLKD